VIWDQSDRASSSVLLNIAEGNAEYTDRGRRRRCDPVRSSALECTARHHARGLANAGDMRISFGCAQLFLAPDGSPHVSCDHNCGARWDAQWRPVPPIGGSRRRRADG
jgi:hypothetical protein